MKPNISHINRYITRALLVTLFFAVLLPACKKTDGYNAIVSTDATKPGPVSNVKIVNFAGGAYLTYTLPDTKNILYVQATYKINDQGVSRQTKSSYYSDSITVGGFAKSQDYSVSLRVVSRANVSSDSLVVTVHPDTPAYLKVLPTVSLFKDFGGVNVHAYNPLKANIGVVLIAPNATTRRYDILNQNYTGLDSIDYSVRGLDTLPQKLGYYVTDEFNNISDTLYATITPLYEALMDKSLFQAYRLPSDVADYGGGYVMTNLWDNNTSDPTYNTQQPIQPLVWPAWNTFDIGQTAKLSRYIMWDRGLHESDNFLWGAGAPETWIIWGRADAPVDENMPDSNSLPALGQMTPKGWIFMGKFIAPPKPSGLPNPSYTADDLTFWNAGFGFDFSIDLPKVRYIRFECLNNMALTNNFYDINEMSFYGDAR
jgi:hypothetical protein